MKLQISLLSSMLICAQLSLAEDNQSNASSSSVNWSSAVPSLSSNTLSSLSSSQKKHLLVDMAKRRREELTKLPMKSLQVMQASNSGQSSQASNAKLPAQLSVDARTGQFTINYTGPTIPGMSDDVSFQLGMTFTGSVTDESMLGLPPGWAYQIDYLNVDSEGNIILNIGGQQYMYDPYNSETGLKYYKLKNLKFEDTGEYYQLTQIDGVIKRFNYAGQLIDITDKYGNKVHFTYSDYAEVFAPENRLMSIELLANENVDNNIAAYQQSIQFSGVSDGILTVTFPDTTTNKFDFSGGRLNSLEDAMGRVTSFTYETYGDYFKKVTAEYPNGHYQEVLLDNSLATTYGETLPAVSQVFDYPLGKNSEAFVTRYEYLVDGNNKNFTGYPDYPDQSTGVVFGADALMQSANAAFTYQVKMTQPTGQYNILNFNYLHLQMTAQTFNGKGQLMSDNTNVYGCQDINDNQHCYLGMPIFSSYEETPGNYQTPSITAATVYDPDNNNRMRTHQVKTQYNEYAFPTMIYTYDKVASNKVPDLSKDDTSKILKQLSSNDESTYFIVSKSIIEYDLSENGYGILLQEDDYDCISNTITRQKNELTSDRKNIGKQILGIYYGGNIEVAETIDVCGDKFSLETLEENISYEKQSDFTYDAYGRVLDTRLSWVEADTTHPGIQESTTSVSYKIAEDNNLMLITSTNPLGGQVRKIYDVHNGNLVQALKQCASDESLDDCAYTVKLTYDAIGRKTSITSSSGLTNYIDYESFANTKESNRVILTRPSGEKLSAYLDGFGRKLKLTSNLKDGKISTTETILKEYAYYAPSDGSSSGQVKTETDIRGNKTTYTYNSEGQVDMVENAIGGRTKQEYDYVLQKSDSYIVLPDDSEYLASSQWHDSQNQVIKSNTYDLNQNTNSEPNASINIYNGQGQLLQTNILKSN